MEADVRLTLASPASGGPAAPSAGTRLRAVAPAPAAPTTPGAPADPTFTGPYADPCLAQASFGPLGAAPYTRATPVFLLDLSDATVTQHVDGSRNIASIVPTVAGTQAFSAS